MTGLRERLTHLTADIRGSWKFLLELIDSRTVRLFQIIVYGWCVIAGLYALLFAAPLSIVSVAMGSAIYAAWLWCNVICPLTVALGCYLARRKSEHLKATTAAANGMLLQLAGNMGMVFTFGAYVAALWTSAWWGKGTYSLFILAALTLCAALLVIGDIRRLCTQVEWGR